MSISATPVQAKAGNDVTPGGTNPNLTLTSTPVSGNLLVAYVFSINTQASITPPAGWTSGTLVSTGSGQSVRAAQAFWKIAGASEPTAITFTTATADHWSCIIAEYNSTTGFAATPKDAEANVADASGTTTTATITPTASVERLIVCVYGNRTLPTFSAEKVNSSTAGVVDAANDPGGNSVTGADMWALDVASTTGTYSGSVTASASAVGAGTTMAFSPVVIAVVPQHLAAAYPYPTKQAV